MEAWLEKMFGGQPVPQYEITSRNIDILTTLMHRNKQQDAAAELVAEDLRQKADEYDTEGSTWLWLDHSLVALLRPLSLFHAY